LRRVRQRLGESGFALVHAVLAERQFIEQIAKAHGETSERARDYWGRRFRECLDELAVLFGHAVTAPAAKPKRDKHAKAAHLACQLNPRAAGVSQRVTLQN
jgi:hypothetical protein